jgi:hypothetical protein
LDRGFEGKNMERINIETLESYMIKKFKPLYNVLHGGGKHEDPLITKKLDDAYQYHRQREAEKVGLFG